MSGHYDHDGTLYWWDELGPDEAVEDAELDAWPPEDEEEWDGFEEGEDGNDETGIH